MSRIDPEKLLRIRDARPSAKHEAAAARRTKAEELVHDLDSQKENLTAEEMQTLRDLRLVKLLASAQRDRKGPKGQIDKETLRRFVTEDLSISETHRVEEILKSDPAQLDAYLAARLEDVGDRAPKPDEYLRRRVRASLIRLGCAEMLITSVSIARVRGIMTHREAKAAASSSAVSKRPLRSWGDDSHCWYLYSRNSSKA